jgi:hypothetical protein
MNRCALYSSNHVIQHPRQPVSKPGGGHHRNSPMVIAICYSSLLAVVEALLCFLLELAVILLVCYSTRLCCL